MKKELIALCAIGRMENRYAREFVKYYVDLGFDKIFIYDNNFGQEEHFEDVLEMEIAAGQVEVIDYRDIPNAQKAAYNDCYLKHGDEYEWIAFFDFDEFLTIVDGSDIHDFMQRYKDADCLLVNYQIFTDGGLLRYDPRPVTERFTEPMPVNKRVTYDFPENCHIKSIVHGGLPALTFSNPHLPAEPALRCVTTNGSVCEQSPFQVVDHSIAYLRHYTTKTIEEWMTYKVRRGFPSSEKLIRRWRARHLQQFFAINERTPEKEQIIREYAELHS